MIHATERARETCNLNAPGRRTFYIEEVLRLERKIRNEAIANIEIIAQAGNKPIVLMK